MDLKISNPNIILHNVLKKYIENKNKINNEYFKNIHLINCDNYINITNNDICSNDQYVNTSNKNIYDENIYDENIYDENIYDENIHDDKNEYENDEDIWDTVINDEKFYINNKIARIFPVLKNFDNFSKIKIDDDSFCYITIREIAEIISKIICYHLLEHNLNPLKSIIIDYTAGVGGNVLSFSKFFKSVYAVELDDLRANYLKNNIDVYGYKNITVINDCAIKFNNNKLIELNPNVIFIDPPWGGSNYKNNKNLTLSLGNVQLEELVIDIVNKISEYYIEVIKINPKEKNNNYNNKFIILKLPKNYDVEYFYNYIKSHNTYSNFNICSYLYILNKMIIIVCELQYKFYQSL